MDELSIMDESSCSSDESALDSEVEIFPFQDGDMKVSDHGAWGDQKNSFYNGNEISEESGSDGADNLEQEEIELAEKKLSGVLMEADYESHWPEVNKLAEPADMGMTLANKSLAVQNLINSLQRCITQLQKSTLYSMTQELTPDGNACIQMKIHLMFCYCMNVLYYLQLKGDRLHHPVVEKMVVLNMLISEVRKGDDQLHKATSPCNTKDFVPSLDDVSMELPGTSCALTSALQYYKQLKETTTQLPMPQELHEKRAITYQIARNKGLMPKRKKEQRNPRVKHRRKYSKALIKRRSQVLPVVHEQCKYGGETSGIRSRLARSVIIK